MHILDRHKYHPPFAEQHLVEKAVQRMASTLPNENDRDLLKEMLDQGLMQRFARNLPRPI
jgi:hypothetical protein